MADLATVQQLIGAALAESARSESALPLIAGDAVHARKRLSIYRANVGANTTNALAATYAIVRKLVGAEFFNGLNHTSFGDPNLNAGTAQFGLIRSTRINGREIQLAVKFLF